MDRLFMAALLLSATLCHAQKKSNLFITADFSGNLGASLSYSYAIKEKFGIGASMEIVEDEVIEPEESFAALADFRYYHNINRSTIIPVLQIGKNIYESEHQFAGRTFSKKGGIQAAIGLGYSYRLFGKASGVFASIKYRMITFKTKVDSDEGSVTEGDAVFSIGIRL